MVFISSISIFVVFLLLKNNCSFITKLPTNGCLHRRQLFATKENNKSITGNSNSSNSSNKIENKSSSNSNDKSIGTSMLDSSFGSMRPTFYDDEDDGDDNSTDYDTTINDSISVETSITTTRVKKSTSDDSKTVKKKAIEEMSMEEIVSSVKEEQSQKIQNEKRKKIENKKMLKQKKSDDEYDSYWKRQMRQDLTQEEKAAATYNIYYALKKDEKITEKLSNTNTRPRTNLNAQQPASFSSMATIGLSTTLMVASFAAAKSLALLPLPF